MSRTPCRRSFLESATCPTPASRAAQRSGILQDQYRIFIHRKILVVQCELPSPDSCERACRTRVPQQFRIGGGSLDDRTVRRQLPYRIAVPPLQASGALTSPDDLRIDWAGTSDVFSQCCPFTVKQSRCKRSRISAIRARSPQHNRNPPSKRRLRVECWRARERAPNVEPGEFEFKPAASSQGDEMNDGVGGAANRHIHRDRILKRLSRKYPGWL